MLYQSSPGKTGQLMGITTPMLRMGSVLEKLLRALVQSFSYLSILIAEKVKMVIDGGPCSF